MKEATRQDRKDFAKRPATPELVEAISAVSSERLGIEVKVEDITGYTPADILDTLFMKVIDGDLYRGKYNLYLVELFQRVNVRLGNKAYKYGELDDTSDTLAIDADNTMEDFNGEYVKELEELYVLTGNFHKKVKVPGMVLSNAWVAAEKMVEFVQLQVESMDKAYARRWENLLWTNVFNGVHAIDATGLTEAIDYNKAMVKQIESLGTTSNVHEGIGAGGVITVKTVNGDETLQPDLMFEPSEFVLFVDTEQYVDVTFENNAQWYNYAATKLNWAKVVPMDFSKYAGFRAITTSGGAEVAPAVVVPEGLKMIAVHKNDLEALVQFEYTETLKGRGDWTVTHMHSKIGVYNIKTTSSYMIAEAAAPVGE